MVRNKFRQKSVILKQKYQNDEQNLNSSISSIDIINYKKS